MNPVLALITDRRRLQGEPGAAWERSLVRQVGEAARAGVSLVQVREPGLEAAALVRLVAACVAAVRGTTCRVVVNDRLDVALAAGAHGVHLRGVSVPADRARRLVPRPLLVGRSVHTVEEVAGPDKGLVDYLLFGAVFETASKPGRPAAGLEALAGAVAATTIPVLALGGVTPERFAAVARTGAAGLAGIGLFAVAAPGAPARIVAAARAAFDTRLSRSLT